MKKFISQYIKIPKFGNLHEKVLFTRVAMSLIAVVVCLAALSYSACAYFTATVSSNSNKIVAANFNLDYSVKYANSGVRSVDSASEILPNADGTYTLAKGVYTLNIKKPTSVEVSTGFCKIEIIDLATSEVKVFYSQQIGVVSPDKSVAPVNERDILLDIKVDNACVKLTSSWGTCAREDLIVTDGGLEFDVESNTPPENDIPNDNSDISNDENVGGEDNQPNENGDGNEPTDESAGEEGTNEESEQNQPQEEPSEGEGAQPEE